MENRFDEEWKEGWEDFGTAGGYKYNPNADFHIGRKVKSFITTLRIEDTKHLIGVVEKISKSVLNDRFDRGFNAGIYEVKKALLKRLEELTN